MGFNEATVVKASLESWVSIPNRELVGFQRFNTTLGAAVRWDIVSIPNRELVGFQPGIATLSALVSVSIPNRELVGFQLYAIGRN